ncbi:MAG: CinA family protein [Burkholderiaceae bacterium]
MRGQAATDRLLDELASRLGGSRQTVAVAESSTGGLISAAMLAVPGASAWYAGGVVIYTRDSRKRLLGIEAADVAGLEPVTEPMVAVFARRVREALGADWGLAELGIAGPTRSRYGHDPGISVIAVDGPTCAACTIVTGSAERGANMQAFTERALALMLASVSPRAPAANPPGTSRSGR